MKKIIMDTVYNHHPEVIEENFSDPELLKYIVENHPGIKNIVLSDIIEITPDRKRYEMKYDIDVPVPGFLEKMIPPDAKGMTIAMEMDRATLSATIDVTTDFMSDKVIAGGEVKFTEKDGKWNQHVEVTMEVKVKLIGGKIEKFASQMAEEVMAKEFQLRSDYLNKKLG